MTIRLPPKNIIDKILAIFGIKRKIILPKENDSVYRNPYVTIILKRENLIATLLRICRKYATSIFHNKTYHNTNKSN